MKKLSIYLILFFSIYSHVIYANYEKIEQDNIPDTPLIIPDKKFMDNYTPPTSNSKLYEATKQLVFVKEQHHFNQLISIPPVEDKLNLILQKIKIAAGAEKIPVKIIINNDQSYSNTSTADGSIFITRATLEDVKTDDELAFIIAHELSHFVLQHHDIDIALNGLNKAYSFLNVIYNSREKNSITESDQNSAIQFLVAKEIYEKVVSTAFHRNQEQGADSLGIDLMVKAGYNPKFITSFLDKMEYFETTNSKVFVKESYIRSTKNSFSVDLDALVSDALQQMLYDLSSKHPNIKLRRDYLLGYLEKHHSNVLALKSSKDLIAIRDKNINAFISYKNMKILSTNLLTKSTIDPKTIQHVENSPYGIVPHAKFYVDIAKNGNKSSVDMLKHLIEQRQNGIPPMEAYLKLANYQLSSNDTDSAIKTIDLLYEDYSQSSVAKNYVIDIYSRSNSFIHKAKAALMQRDFLGIM